MTEALFIIRGLTKGYGDKVVLAGLDFDVQRGESLVILGGSGSGKSVTLRQLNGLDQPDAGTVVFDGIEISRLEEPNSTQSGAGSPCCSRGGRCSTR